MRLFSMLPLLLLATAGRAAPLPEPVRLMVEAAVDGGNQTRIDAVAAIATETHPQSSVEIMAIVARGAEAREAQRQHRLRQANLLKNWRGSGELGGSAATGNSDTVTLAIGVNLEREGVRWRHEMGILADLQRSDGTSNQERYAVSYQGNLKVSERSYLLGRLGWERNRLAGIHSRWSQALGVGYQVVASAPVRWDLEGGPSLQRTRFQDYSEDTFAVRLASNFRWQIAPGSRFTQVTSGIFQEDNSSIIATTALTSKLWGPMSARLSLNTQYETNPPDDLRRLDTVTRATLVYEFGGS